VKITPHAGFRTMSDGMERVVFDCNILAQALIRTSGSAGRCVERVLDGSVTLHWSDYVLAEIDGPSETRGGGAQDEVSVADGIAAARTSSIA